MNAQPFMPAKTAQEIANPAGPGARHDQAKRIAVPMIGNGHTPEVVFATLRGMYAADVTDDELQKVVSFAVKANPSPSGFGTSATPRAQWPAYNPKPIVKKAALSPVEHAAWWLGGLELNAEKFSELSPITVPNSAVESVKLMFELIYGAEECVNIVCQFTKDGEKANPKGGGRTLTRNEWLEYFAVKGVPQSEAGAWIRPNPCSPIGSGSGGAIMDADIEQHRFLLLESDCLPLPVQFALYSKLKIPIAVVVSSGGKSVHAWARISARDAEQYKEFAKRILTALAPFGIDQANKNSSRLSRLAGATRIIGASGDGAQQLLWLNPKVSAFSEADIVTLEETLLLPLIAEKPLKPLMRSAIERYEELINNRGKLGVPTGIADFDSKSGGLKPGSLVVIAAETGGGKSTLALNFVNTALKSGKGVALFTLEMDRDEIIDALVALNCKVNRDGFNTGDFKEGELAAMASRAGWIGNLPLWIFDSSIMTVDDVRKSTLQLKSENKIDLVVVDYVQLLTSNEFPNSREQQIASISRGLRSLAKEAKLPVVGLSQLNDEGKLRESRVLAHEAHIVFMLEELETKPVLRIVKGRRIRRGTFDLHFESQYGMITSAARGPEYSDVPQNVTRLPHPE